MRVSSVIISACATACLGWTGAVALPQQQLPRVTRCRTSPRCCTSPPTVADEESAIALCKEWIKQHVVRLGLCPYAAKPFAEETIRYAVSHAVGDAELLEDFFVEGTILLDADPEDVATTMLITSTIFSATRAETMMTIAKTTLTMTSSIGHN